MTNLEASIRRVLACLDAKGVRHAVVGGLAVSARTEPRFTRDADLCVAVVDDAEAEQLVHALQSDGYELLALVEQEAAGRLATARLTDSRAHGGSNIIDLLFASSGIEEEVIEQAEIIELFDGLRTPIATVAALLALKVLSQDDHRRPQDRVDVLALLSVATGEDVEHARGLLGLIERRGFARTRDLHARFDALITEHRRE